MTPLRLSIPPQVAEFVRSLHPDIKQSVKAALRAIAANPEIGTPLKRELEGLWKYRVRRYRIVYGLDRSQRTLRIMAVGHRQTVYEALSEELQGQKARQSK